MKQIIFILVFMPSLTNANKLVDNHLCQHWQERQNVKPWYDLSELTEENAKKNLKVLEDLLTIESNDYKFDYWAYSKVDFHIRGYMMKRELLDAWANHEHDADEIGDLCHLWLYYSTAP